MNNENTNTRVERKELRFYKDGDGWYADVAGHTQAQNRMVAGADRLCNVTHTVFGEHPRTIYIHSIAA